MSDPYFPSVQHGQQMTPYPATTGYGRPGSLRSVSSNWGWAVAACIFFWPLGFSAVSAAGRVLPALLDGDTNAARTDSAKARRLGIIALCVSIGLIVLYFGFIFVVIALAAHSCNTGDC